MPATITASRLASRFKRAPAAHSETNRIRIHRAISWLARAEREADDPDARFIFLWITFNAAYACEFAEDTSSREQLQQFITALVAVDADKRLHQIVFERFTGPVRTLVANKYVFAPFWRALRDHDGSGRWEQSFTRSRNAALAAVLHGETAKVLSIVFDRLYVLRNQLIHGGATWAGSVNREQVKDGAAILMALVPTIIDLMIGNPGVDYGDVQYPVI